MQAGADTQARRKWLGGRWDRYLSLIDILMTNTELSFSNFEEKEIDQDYTWMGYVKGISRSSSVQHILF